MHPTQAKFWEKEGIYDLSKYLYPFPGFSTGKKMPSGWLEKDMIVNSPLCILSVMPKVPVTSTGRMENK